MPASSANRVVVVTGAASGIGAATVSRFLAQGATVYGIDLEVAKMRDGARMLKADVSSPEALCAAFRSILADEGQIDVLCNNAGIGSSKDVLTVDPEEWDLVFGVNVRGVYLGIKYALPGMLARGSGVIINIASVAGLVGLRDRAAYCASKGAVIALTRQVAVQTAGTGVTCNCVCPGTVDSPWVSRLLSEASDPDARRAELIDRQPLGRLGTPDEIAAAALYLASPEAGFMTGSALVIDGGILAG